MTTTVDTDARLTATQLLVTTMLADGAPLALIAHTLRTDLDAVHDHIWSACRAVGAVDRTNLVAIVLRAQQPAPAAVVDPGVADELVRVQHRLGQLQTELAQARRLHEQAETARRRADTEASHLRQQHEHDADLIAQLQRDLRRAATGPAVGGLAEVQQQLASVQAELSQTRRQLEQTEAARGRAGSEASRLRQQTEADADTIAALQDELAKAKTAPRAKKPAPAPVVVDGVDLAKAVALAEDQLAQWFLDQLQWLSHRQRDIAGRTNSTQPANLTAVAKADTLRDAAAAIAQAWQRKTATARPTGGDA